MFGQESVEDQEKREQENINNRSLNHSFYSNYSSGGEEEGKVNMDEEGQLMEELAIKRLQQENTRVISEQVYENLKLLIFRSKTFLIIFERFW